MIGSSVKNNLKTVLRDPTTLLAILAAIILEFMYGINMGYQDMYGNDLGKDFYLTEGAYERILNTMMNLVANPIANIVFVFMGVVLAINLFKEIRLQTYDIVAASGMTFGKYYLSKIISYYILALMLSFGLTMLHEILFVIFCLPANPNCDMGKVLIANFVMMIALYTSALWHSFTYALFLSALTGIPLIGVLLMRCTDISHICSAFWASVRRIIGIFIRHRWLCFGISNIGSHIRRRSGFRSICCAEIPSRTAFGQIFMRSEFPMVL